MEQEVKLDRFRNAVYAEIEAKSEKIREEGFKEKEAKIQNNKEAYLKQAQEIVKSKNAQTESTLKREIAHEKLDAHRSVLAKRTEITNRIFDNVRNELNKFCETSKYKAYLLGMLQKFSKDNTYKNVQIKLCKRDMCFSDDIKKLLGSDTVVTESLDVSIGGFIAVDSESRSYYDETLSQKLSEQHSYFIENSGFTL